MKEKDTHKYKNDWESECVLHKKCTGKRTRFSISLGMRTFTLISLMLFAKRNVKQSRKFAEKASLNISLFMSFAATSCPSLTFV